MKESATIPPMLRAGRLAIAAALACSALAAVAQEEEPPAPRAWRLAGEALARADQVGRPGAEDVERLKARIRLGLLWNPDPRLELGVAVEALGASQEILLVNDNEPRSAFELDSALLRWLPLPGGELAAGKAELPLALTSMLWDADLRPLGLAWRQSLPVRAYDSLLVAAGLFAGEHRFDDASRIAAAQLGWRLREGAAAGGEVLLSYLAFDELDDITASGLARTNRRRADGELASDFELLDLQLAGRLPAGQGMIAGRLDLVENLGASEAERGVRAELAWAAGPEPRGPEAGLSAQRIQADAVMAAFNSDDWWFHSASRGVSLWAGWRFAQGLALRGAFFSERRDDQERRTERALLDVTWSTP